VAPVGDDWWQEAPAVFLIVAGCMTSAEVASYEKPSEALREAFMDNKRSGILAGYLPESEMAEQLGKTQRTLARWRSLNVGPPFTRNGRKIEYSVAGARSWLAAGGTNRANVERPQDHP